ncbi:nicotinamide mononucleotide transporter family protein [Rathayibacter sp. KR2-224]|uniref:nicotinamide mononucleotide transporter family protein n=1 Tax=Rathayibacter sp. KR2-224 TaxID=3400913 RepID=UPI003C07FEEA
MPAVLDWLTTHLATFGSEAVTIDGLLGALFFLVAELAVARSLRWAWPACAVLCAGFAVLAVAEARYADAGIRLVLAGLCAYGWRVRRSGRVPGVRRPTSREAAYGVVLLAIASVVAAFALTAQVSAQSAPANAASTVASWGAAVVVAGLFVQVAALARGIVVGWWAALGTALVGLALQLAAGSWPTAALAFASGIVAVYGLSRWRRETVASAEDVVAPARRAVDEDVAA